MIASMAGIIVTVAAVHQHQGHGHNQSTLCPFVPYIPIAPKSEMPEPRHCIAVIPDTAPGLIETVTEWPVKRAEGQKQCAVQSARQ
jgi:hypothetical protein